MITSNILCSSNSCKPGMWFHLVYSKNPWHTVPLAYMVDPTHEYLCPVLEEMALCGRTWDMDVWGDAAGVDPALEGDVLQSSFPMDAVSVRCCLRFMRDPHLRHFLL